MPRAARLFLVSVPPSSIPSPTAAVKVCEVSRVQPSVSSWNTYTSAPTQAMATLLWSLDWEVSMLQLLAHPEKMALFGKWLEKHNSLMDRSKAAAKQSSCVVQ